MPDLTTATPTTATLPTGDLISTAPLGPGDVARIFDVAAQLKADRTGFGHVLAGKKLGMLFEKESLRTRFTFDIGMQELGGSAVFLDHRHARLGSREAISDLGRNLERWVDGAVLRVYKHRHVEEFAEACSAPVINGLSDLLHPCQALSDFFTLREHWGTLAGRKLAYVGDGNNTCHSLLQTGARLGVHVTVCSPEGFEPNSRILNDAMIAARETGAEIRIVENAHEGVAGADAVYTDVWASMGQEDEIEERAAIFSAYRVDPEMMERAAPDALFMHCLPAHRGAEVTAEVIDGPRSIVFDIAENRLHVQKAIMAMLMAPDAVAALG
ncbi:ornithine carbamoyltransferase [Engelhardtia mirabilis]|uniref:Ornithine carbamoyltransferase n=1 Tax=Engelhardtia mirabilis TaxID=2528011 RepID=A0A518BQ08_9BACT|nr:Ornithine carbamoyltransferase [Planctomycetes bacterium Pla133]QDV03378.1 Ornithine carbamoyltransferase [Planctomycetes bacterium Pla86]